MNYLNEALDATEKNWRCFPYNNQRIRRNDSDGFKGYVRMDVDHFEELVHLSKSKIPMYQVDKS